MSKFLIAVVISAIAAFCLAPRPAQARHCSGVVATARGITQNIATNRAERRLEIMLLEPCFGGLAMLLAAAKSAPCVKDCGMHERVSIICTSFESLKEEGNITFYGIRMGREFKCAGY